jgi:predicted site-specific integrase-resolvase
MKTYSRKQTCELLCISPGTLKNWRKSGKIKSVTTLGGQHRYIIDTGEEKQSPVREVICYCRVSSPKQRNDLERQALYMQDSYPEAQVIKDVGSGLNFKRQGLLTILERAMSGTPITLVVAYKDRLARFGFDLIEHIINRTGGTVVVQHRIDTSPTAELVSDLLSIIHVFSCRIYGLRKYKSQIKEDKDIPDGLPEVGTPSMDGCSKMGI